MRCAEAVPGKAGVALVRMVSQILVAGDGPSKEQKTQIVSQAADGEGARADPPRGIRAYGERHALRELSIGSGVSMPIAFGRR